MDRYEVEGAGDSGGAGRVTIAGVRVRNPLATRNSRVQPGRFRASDFR